MDTLLLEKWNCSRWHPREIVALGYIDGPTAGVLRLKDGSVLRFKMVAYDLARELRVLTLGTLTSTDFDAIVATIQGALGAPRWPTWVPLWKFANLDQRRETEAIINGVFGKATTVAAVLCDDTIMDCRSLRSIDADQPRSTQAWFEFMGVSATDT